MFTDIVGRTALNADQDFTLDTYEFGDVPVAPVPIPGKYRFV